MWNKRISFLILMIIIHSACVTGCNQQVNTEKTVIDSEIIELERTAVKGDGLPENIYLFNNIAQIIGGNTEGELLGFLWKDIQVPNTIASDTLYLIDPVAAQARKLFTPQDGYRIFSAVLDQDWIVVSEQSEKKWIIHLINRRNNEEKAICSGDYFGEGGLDYPSLTLYKGILAYNTSEKTPDSMISTVGVMNLGNGQQNTVMKVEGLKQYLGAPVIYEDYLVFHRGEWTEKMAAEVYLYNIKDKILKKISGEQMAIQPSIWGKYVVWAGYSPDILETKNVILYNIENNKCTTITDASPENHKEYWALTFSQGIVSWFCNFQNNPTLYCTATNEIRSFNIEGQQTSVCGSWLTWRNPQKTVGTYIVGLSSFLPELDLSGSTLKRPTDRITGYILEDTSVHEEASHYSEEAFTLKKGNLVRTLARKVSHGIEWIFIEPVAFSIPNPVGWIESTKITTQLPATKPNQGFVKDVNIFAEPSFDSMVLQENYTAPAQIMKRVGNWTNCSFAGGLDGWVEESDILYSFPAEYDMGY